MRFVRPSALLMPAGSVLAEYDARHPKRLARDEATLPAEELAIAAEIRSQARRSGFAAGRLALHAALAESADPACAARPVLRDARGRPAPTWEDAPPISIAHSRIRALAGFAPRGSCAAIGVDVEEVDEHRAHALVRMSLSPEENARVAAVDPAMLAGPIALWCAREACVKAHALEVGWFGTTLVARCFEAISDPASLVEGAERAWRIEIAFESRAPFVAHAWQARDAVFAAAVRLA